MIQELRSLLINHADAFNFTLMPSNFVPFTLRKVESQIRESILGGPDSSIEYRCYIANKIVSAIYRDHEFSDILNDAFDTRKHYTKEDNELIKYTSYNIKVNPENILVDARKAKENIKSRIFSYDLSTDFSNPAKNIIIVSGGQGNVNQSFVVSDEEKANGTKWLTISETNILIKIQSIEQASGERINIKMPFVFSGKKILDTLLSIQGLIDRLALVAEIYPEIQQKFNSESRIDRKLFAIVIAYGILVKNNIK